MSCLVQPGRSWPRTALKVQPNGTLVSMPRTTASLPWLITRRASNGSSTSRRKPFPGPPACASMYLSNWRIRLACSRTDVMSSQEFFLSG